jgi:hypothetical protein
MGKNSPVEGSTRLASWGFLFLGVFESFSGLGGLGAYGRLGLGFLSLYSMCFTYYYSFPRLWLLGIDHTVFHSMYIQ